MLNRAARIVVLTALAIMFCGLIAVADKPAPPEQDKIRQALEGKTPDNGSGDGVLDDVLNVIKQRGSVLDGSSLDVTTDAITQPADETKKAHVAEQLLKSARMLEAIGDSGRQRSLLIRQIRSEARKLLSE